MKILERLLNFILVILIILIILVDAKGARGGGGRSSGGSRISSRGFRSISRSNYRSSYRVYPAYSQYKSNNYKWYAFGSGIAAFSIMSSLAIRGRMNYRENFKNVSNYTYNLLNQTNQNKDIYYCHNNYDFNGTVFGAFECPLPEFDKNAKYCCGSFEEQSQFCCDHFDKFGVEEGESFLGLSLGQIILIIAVFLLILFCSLYDRCKSLLTSSNNQQTEVNSYNLNNRQEDQILLPMSTQNNVKVIMNSNNNCSDKLLTSENLNNINSQNKNLNDQSNLRSLSEENSPPNYNECIPKKNEKSTILNV